MSIKPTSILEQKALAEIMTGEVTHVNINSVIVKFRPDFSLVVNVSTKLLVGQLVSIAFPSGNLSSPQFLGVISGSSQRVIQVLV